MKMSPPRPKHELETRKWGMPSIHADGDLVLSCCMTFLSVAEDLHLEEAS